MAPYEPAMSADSFGARWRYFIHSSVSGLTAWRGGQRRVRLEMIGEIRGDTRRTMRGSRCAPPRGRRMPTCYRASRGRAEGAEETPRTRSPAKGGVRESARRNTCHRIADGLKKRVASSSDRGPTMIKALLRHLHGASRPAALHCRRARVLHERASLRHISAPVDASRTPRDLPVAPSRVDSLRVRVGVAADDGERPRPGDRGAPGPGLSTRGQGRERPTIFLPSGKSTRASGRGTR